ncbi:DUF523 domain-containing protein [Faecalicoccus acidiformans]|uniref:DUF523 domain-containing protein n=1 Tax=Faecalicoccus acidiformans TaxID=915173 RepID=A0ABS2FML5_9FIRM|nr:DUF523 domain-containing protein [Faecalicoccus acidiformans]MBM6830624.1 DUF523 domain-containing protein [Faecalicoccus acidiformans]MDM8202964.1 DUF523 domain-containing protein [Faecalicoccus acidiformans]
MKILISACLCKERCRYDGRDCFRKEVMDLIAGHEIVPVCPEAYLGIPRSPCEILNGRLIDKNGEDLTESMQESITKILNEVHLESIDLAILKARSPTCGYGWIFDGNFKNRLIYGYGMFAKALADRGIRILEVD